MDSTIYFVLLSRLNTKCRFSPFLLRYESRFIFTHQEQVVSYNGCVGAFIPTRKPR